MPVRKIPPGYRGTTGVLPSAKIGRGADYESSLERDLLTLLEFDANVQRFEEQPLRVDYRDRQGRPRHYTPDLLVWYRTDTIPGRWTRPLLCEVKYDADLRADWSRLRRRLAAARLYAWGRGWRFAVLTEHEIRTPYLDNARFLLPFRVRPRQPGTERQLREALGDLREADAETLLAAVFRDVTSRAEAIPALWALVGYREVLCDLTRPLTMRTRLWMADPWAEPGGPRDPSASARPRPRRGSDGARARGR